MNIRFAHTLSAAQRQSFVISLTAFLTGLLLIILVSILMLIVARGGAYFWPTSIMEVTYKEANDIQKSVLAQVMLSDEQNNTTHIRYSDKQSPYGVNVLLSNDNIIDIKPSESSAEVRLVDGRALVGKPLLLSSPEKYPFSLAQFKTVKSDVSILREEIEVIRRTTLAFIHEQLADFDAKGVEHDAPAREKLMQSYVKEQARVEALERQLARYTLTLGFTAGQQHIISIADIDGLYFVSNLSFIDTLDAMFDSLSTFLSEPPKQANTAGGVYPALFGTILMVFLMTIIVTPFGVLAAIYLSEYAPDNLFTTVIRISVSNMAGVPSIVYGVFGLGFFVYTVGGNIDALFFADTLPSPTMGSPGVFWAALTMAILTLPVVIVATEEGLRRVPNGLKSGSYALGATKYETIVKTILPIASPGIMTGVILAIARAAGEVAPLMLVGAVKFAPNLPIDGDFPYLHLDRQFMHLGVLIYDGAFHSQTNVKSASMMFASCLLLLIVVFVLNLFAVVLRTRLRKRYLSM